MKTATGYIRVSTGDQQNSLEVQRVAIERLALAHGYSLGNVHVDEGLGLSGYEKAASGQPGAPGKG